MSELMAMLTASAPPMNSIRGSSQSKITASDVAACLTHCDRHTYLFGLAKFSLDNYLLPRVEHAGCSHWRASSALSCLRANLSAFLTFLV